MVLMDMDMVVAVLGILGTIGGTALGAWLSRRASAAILDRQLQRDDRQRRVDRCLEAIQTLNTAAAGTLPLPTSQCLDLAMWGDTLARLYAREVHRDIGPKLGDAINACLHAEGSDQEHQAALDLQKVLMEYAAQTQMYAYHLVQSSHTDESEMPPEIRALRRRSQISEN